MSTSKMKFLNVVPSVRLKKEKVLDEDEDVVLCKFCAKGFANHTALTNHARMEHFEEYAAGEELALAAPKTDGPKKSKAQQREETKQQIKKKTQELISSMSPTNLMSFASPDVSYIIIKQDGTEVPEGRRRERTRRDRGDRGGEKAQVLPIAEVLQQKSRYSSMSPTNLISFASPDVSYIIIKQDGTEVPEGRRRERTRRDRGDRGGEKAQVLPIAGPFECLHPSNLVAEGTCHQIFFSCCEYSAHFRDEHTRRRKGIRCQVCEKPLSSDNEMPHCCESCGAGFKTYKELSNHISTAHVKLKPFQCHICLKRFTQQGGLHLHMRMHTGDRPFNCTFCPKAFTQKSGLEQHLRIHTKVRPYRCVICSKNFCQSIHLKQHMRTHTNVSPFECALCQKRFKQSSHLNYHLKCHNPANLTDEQKEKYKELLGIIGQNDIDQSDVGTVMEVEVGEGLQLQYALVEEGGEYSVKEEYVLDAGELGGVVEEEAVEGLIDTVMEVEVGEGVQLQYALVEEGGEYSVKEEYVLDAGELGGVVEEAMEG